MKLVVAVLGMTAACATEPSSINFSEPPQRPTIHVALTDAPGDFESVWVTIARVEVEASGIWSTLVEQPQRFDLLTLQNDVTAALGDAALEPGHYGQLRLIVEDASLVVDGVESPLEIASGAQTGIKIDLDRELEPEMAYSLTLDFDAHQSVKQTGHGYLMTPVIFVKDLTATPLPEAEPAPEGLE